MHLTGRQVYEATESDVEDNTDVISDSEETHPVVINEHLNNPLIKMDIKVINNNTLFIYFFYICKMNKLIV